MSGDDVGLGKTIVAGLAVPTVLKEGLVDKKTSQQDKPQPGNQLSLFPEDE